MAEEKFGVWCTDRHGNGSWCTLNSKDMVGDVAFATKHRDSFTKYCAGIYEVRPYLATEQRAVVVSTQGVKSMSVASAPIQPTTIRQTPVIDANALAFSLFSTDPAVESFVAERGETALFPERLEPTLRIAFDRDENGWATRARTRAARVIERMGRK